MKAVLDTKPTSIYNDKISQYYHFPKRYLGILKKCVGDWVVLRRPRADGGNLAYFATARVTHLTTDPDSHLMTYAHLSDYLEFETPTPWTENGRYAEEALRSIPRVQVGVYLRGRSVRELQERDFSAIVGRGLSSSIDLNGIHEISQKKEEVWDSDQALHGERTWKVEHALTKRIVRDRHFRKIVCDAYQNHCAVTRLHVLDLGGNPEVQAAHVWAVADGGPDIVQNGIALSGTIHWLFDRYLLSLTDDFRVILSPSLLPETRERLELVEGQKILLPNNLRHHPHVAYVQKHRETFGKKNSTT